MTKIDKRTVRGKELAERLNKQTILENMPKIYFVSDLGMGRYRVGRTDWPSDAFELVPAREFDVFAKICKQLSWPLLDKSNYNEED